MPAADTMPPMRHVVWDWNGTLFDDLHIVVEAVNAALASVDAEPIDAEGYRTHYGRPVHVFYERLLGRRLAAEEWRRIDEGFHDAYRAALGRAGLTADACQALAEVAGAGRTQSLLSMWWHDELVPFVARFGVDGYMLRVDGNRRDAGEVKAEHLRSHLASLGVDAPDALVVGDALDDARAAAEVGARCVLYDGGSHHRHELEGAGVPVAASLREAVRVGGAAPATS